MGINKSKLVLVRYENCNLLIHKVFGPLLNLRCYTLGP